MKSALLHSSLLLLTFSSACVSKSPDFARPLLTESGHALTSSAYDNVFNRIVAADRACDDRWLALKTPAEVAEFQSAVRREATAALGGFPERTPLNGRVVGCIERKGYRVEKVLFESRPAFFVTGHLYIPTGRSGPFPALLAPCGHSFDGKAAPWYSNTGVVGTERGFVVLVCDPIDQGERYQKRDGRDWWDSTAEHDNIGVRALLLGESAAQVRIFDGMRAVDYLASRTDIVDPARICVAGISGGGTLSAYVNAFEPRVCCASPSGFLSTIRDVYDNCGPQDAEQVIFGQLSYGLNHLGLVCLRAPSPILVSASHGDYFPFMGTTDMVEKAKRVFGVMDAAEKAELLSVSGEHHWYNSQKDIQFGWMTRWLAGQNPTLQPSNPQPSTLNPQTPQTPQTPLFQYIGYDYEEGRGGIAADPPEVRNVTRTGRVLDLPGARSIYDIYRDKLAALKASRAPVSRARVRAASGIRSAAELRVSEISVAGGAVLVRDDDRTMIPVATLQPSNPPTLQPSNPPTFQPSTPVLIVSDARTKGELADTVRGYLAAGRPVAIADIRGFGETGFSRHAEANGEAGDEEIARCMMALGDSLVARRAEDVVVAALYAAKTFGGKPLLHAEGRAVVPAAHARFLEPDAFAEFEIVREPESWERLIADETATMPFSCIVRGALAFYDWTNLK